jgi:hypothetical protein
MMSKRKGTAAVITQDHVISTLSHIRYMVDALIAVLKVGPLEYSQLPAPLSLFAGEVYRKDCPPPPRLPLLEPYVVRLGPRVPCPGPVYAKDCPEPVETTSLKIPAREARTMTVLVRRKRTVAKKRGARKKNA